MPWILAFFILPLAATIGYIVWRDRRRTGTRHGSGTFVEHGEGKSAAYQADMARSFEHTP